MSKREFLNQLTKKEIENLKKELHEQRGGKCYICDQNIDLATQRTDIDHIVAIELGGDDDKHNFALTHAGCNRSKGIKDLQLQRYIAQFRKLIDEKMQNGSLKDMITVADVLLKYGGSKSNISIKYIDNGDLSISYEANTKPNTLNFNLLSDEQNGKFTSFIGMMPKEIIFHDPSVNPRSIVDLEPMIEEFYQKRPQLQPSLAYIINEQGKGKIKLFDGQHKAAAQLINGADKLFVRVFINPPIEDLIKTNFRAHTKLAQIHFPQLIADKISHSIFYEEFEKYKNDSNLQKASEKDFIKSLPADLKSEYRNYLKGYYKYDVLTSNENKLMDYVETVSARSKRFPLSFESLRRGLLETFLFLKAADDNIQTTEKMRKIERENLQKIMDIIAEEILVNKFNASVGIFKIEQRLQNEDPHITNDHLLAYRMLRQASLISWAEQFRDAVNTYINSNTKYKKDWHKEKYLWAELDQNDFLTIRAMIKYIKTHPAWTVKEDNMVNQISTTKVNDWREIIIEGKLPGAVQSIYDPMNSGKILEKALVIRNINN